MGENTGIEWTDHTFNPWIGCTKVSPACDNCYAEAFAKRYGWAKWGHGEQRRRTSDANWQKPLQWNRAARLAGVRRRVFCASLADVFDVEVPDAWRLDLMLLIHATPDLDWLLLTKRPQVAWKFFHYHGPVPDNVWMGTTVENNAMAAARIPPLLGIRARRHFLSCEPLLEDVLLDSLWLAELDWIIVGGESGHGARPTHPDWVRAMRDRCRRAGVYFFFKQWGDLVFNEVCEPEPYERIGKKKAGALLDNREWKEFPVTA